MSLYNGLHNVTKEVLNILEKAIENKSDAFFSVTYSSLDFLTNHSAKNISCLRDVILPYLFFKTEHKSEKRRELLNGFIESAYKKDEFIQYFLHSKVIN
jgi:hypothetical protein